MTFQSTLPHGERPVLLTRTLLCNDFNPRSRMGSDMTCRLTARARPRFQSTLPHGERLGGGVVERFRHVHFNPRSRMGSDVEGHGPAVSHPISIHAPAWGATRHAHHRGHQVLISIHAPAWGATDYRLPHVRFSEDFNPRSRMGSD